MDIGVMSCFVVTHVLVTRRKRSENALMCARVWDRFACLTLLLLSSEWLALKLTMRIVQSM